MTRNMPEPRSSSEKLALSADSAASEGGSAGVVLAKPAATKFIFLTILLDFLGIGLIIPVAPKLVEQLNGPSENNAFLYGALMSLYAVMLFIFAPIFGAVSDRFGRRPVILISLLGTGLDYIVAAFAPTLWLLFVTRAINGISGANFVTCQAFIADTTPPEKRAGAYGLVGAAIGLGFILGPVAGGFLGAIDIRWPYMAAGILAIINWLYGYFVLPESLPKERRSPLSISKFNPMSNLKFLFKLPTIGGLAVAFFFLNAAQFALHGVWVLYTGYRYGWDEKAVGISLMVVGIGAAVVQGALARPIIARIGAPWAVIAGLVIGAMAYVLYGLATEGWMIYAIVAAASFGGIAGPAIQSIITGLTDPTQQGRVQGGLHSMTSLAQICGPLLGTWLFGYFTKDAGGTHLIPGAPFFASAVLAVIGTLLVVRVLREKL
jgi:MFS transporter, DHA1 family, tetracycline resistance protein